MKEALEIALDQNRDEDARIQALDDFEMLVERIDNANGMHMNCIITSLGLETHRRILRPRQAEDVGPFAIPFDVPKLFRRDQGAYPLDHRYRSPKQPMRPKLGTYSSRRSNYPWAE